jgi:hypothetical protein
MPVHGPLVSTTWPFTRQKSLRTTIFFGCVIWNPTMIFLGQQLIPFVREN